VKAIIVGRHTGDLLGYEIIERRNITFPATSAECKPVFENLLSDAFAADAALIFQALPGQMVAAITSNIGRGGPITHVPVGQIVSIPGERGAATMTVDPTNAEALAAAVFANPNAKIINGVITVDPPMKFKFSHIEWLNGG
jgi:hypothetical protein